jgi:hypothetical protein
MYANITLGAVPLNTLNNAAVFVKMV